MIRPNRLILAAGVLALGSCAGLAQLKPVPLAVEGTEIATPPVLGAFKDQEAVTSAEAWRSIRVPALREAFETELYGPTRPASALDTQFGTPKLIDANAYGGLARVEVVAITLRYRARDGTPQEGVFELVIARPNAAKGPVPVILKMEFCPFDQVYGLHGFSATKGKCGAGPIGKEAILWWSLGKYHLKPPIKEALARGYAYASIAAWQVHADHGQLAFWAFQYSRAIDYLETDPALDPKRTAVYGHSRYGKSALIAAAFDERIDAVIAHQSGRAGAALTRSVIGEPMAKLVESFPNWLSETASGQAKTGKLTLSVDQHQLLALIAPRPVLLGHARRDSWSDPQGAFRAAQGADPAYELLGSAGLNVDRLDTFDAQADLAFWMRKGTHGETEEDWPAFFRFLGAHFQPENTQKRARR